jgi:hypothetical protein
MVISNSDRKGTETEILKLVDNQQPLMEAIVELAVEK